MCPPQVCVPSGSGTALLYQEPWCSPKESLNRTCIFQAVSKNQPIFIQLLLPSAQLRREWLEATLCVSLILLEG